MIGSARGERAALQRALAELKRSDQHLAAARALQLRRRSMAEAPPEIPGKVRDVVEAQGVRHLLDAARRRQQLASVLQPLLSQPNARRRREVRVEPTLQVPDRDTKVTRDALSVVVARSC